MKSYYHFGQSQLLNVEKIYMKRFSHPESPALWIPDLRQE